MKMLIAALLFAPVMALAHGHEHHREHSAHKHGQAELSIAFQGHEGKVEFKSPAESIIGFEHEAVKEKDIKARDAALTKFEKEIMNIVAFQNDLKCVFTKEKVEQVIEGGGSCGCGGHGEHKEGEGHTCDHKDGKTCEHKTEDKSCGCGGEGGECKCGKHKKAKGTHSDFVASFNVKCERSPEDSTVKVEIQKFFPKVKETRVTLLVGALQKEVKLKKKAESIEIK